MNRLLLVGALALVATSGCRRDPNRCWWCDRDTTPPVAPEGGDEFDDPGQLWEGYLFLEDGEPAPVEGELFFLDVAEDGLRCEAFWPLEAFQVATECSDCEGAWTARLLDDESDQEGDDCSAAEAQRALLGSRVGVGHAEETLWFWTGSGAWFEAGEAWVEDEEEEGGTFVGFEIFGGL